MSSEGGGVMSMGWLERWMVFVGSHMGGQNGMFFNRAFSEGWVVLLSFLFATRRWGTEYRKYAN